MGISKGLVAPGGYDLDCLVLCAEEIFGRDLLQRFVPKSIEDARRAGQYLALGRYTLAALHAQRLHQIVVSRYLWAERGATPTLEEISNALLEGKKAAGIDADAMAMAWNVIHYHPNPLLDFRLNITNPDEVVALFRVVTACVYILLGATRTTGDAS